MIQFLRKFRNIIFALSLLALAWLGFELYYQTKETPEKQKKTGYADKIFGAEGGPFGKSPFKKPDIDNPSDIEFKFKKQISESGLDIDIEERLFELLKNKTPGGKNSEVNSKSGGERFTVEKLEDGSRVEKVYWKSGIIKGVKWNLAKGGVVFKTHYKNGKLKALKWKRPDHASTTLILSPEGYITSRTDEFSGGEKRVTEFNASGGISGRWRVNSAGDRRKEVF